MSILNVTKGHFKATISISGKEDVPYDSEILMTFKYTGDNLNVIVETEEAMPVFQVSLPKRYITKIPITLENSFHFNFVQDGVALPKMAGSITVIAFDEDHQLFMAKFDIKGSLNEKQYHFIGEWDAEGAEILHHLS